jgi:peptidoglycan/LPS O-acetylase OafA/YrhL
MGGQGVTLFLVISDFLIHEGLLKSGASFRLSEFSTSGSDASIRHT